MTREQWLYRMAGKLEKTFNKHGYKYPKKLRISCGWPITGGMGQKSRTIGQCFPPEWSKDKHTEIFISPYLSKDWEVSETLAHELVHAVVGCKAGHRSPFKKAATAIGLEGKMTATHAGKELKAQLKEWANQIGRYPHATLDYSKRKKDGTRMIKLECWSCGYVVRTSRKWIEIGLPHCCCGGHFDNV